MTIIAARDSAIDSEGRRDLDDIMTIMEDAFEPRFGEGWSRSQCSGILGDAHSWVTISRENDEPAGFALSRMIVDEAELLLIAVRPAFRGKGIGRELLQRVCGTAADRGAKRLHLEVREGNAAANLYHAMGFEKIGRRRNYYSGGNGERFDAITLALQIDRDSP
ncbi:MAG: ribosomal protein S18-alanine N-acetyltransferase [Parasphingopyxis sp.]|uniref:ribosomal protein S18-alanine N-acetyltransferase n=1 Tax=Parasphingopyxis sp. TaxID=1920299 RepID=UPI003FA0C54D